MKQLYKLMLVDDEPWALSGMEEIIDWEAAGFTIVAQCSCGQEAILQARLCQPDAIVTDIRMPDMSGIQMIHAIRQIPLPVECVVVSAYSDFEVAREAIRLSAVYYLVKPLSAADVHEVALLLKEKLDRSVRPHHTDRPAPLRIDWEHPIFPKKAKRVNGRLLLSDRMALHAYNIPKAQPVQIGSFAGLLVNTRLPELPPDTGESLPSPGFGDGEMLIHSAYASLDGGFRFASATGDTPLAAADIQLYLWEHLEEEVTLKMLAGAFYLTETYICDLFKKQVGETVLEFLRRIRLHRAIRLLTGSRLTLREVASKCGYSDYSYFGRHFKAETGLPPELYRKQNRIS